LNWEASGPERFQLRTLGCARVGRERDRAGGGDEWRDEVGAAHVHQIDGCERRCGQRRGSGETTTSSKLGESQWAKKKYPPQKQEKENKDRRKPVNEKKKKKKRADNEEKGKGNGKPKKIKKRKEKGSERKGRKLKLKKKGQKKGEKNLGDVMCTWVVR
jgi:hypothetical protein